MNPQRTPTIAQVECGGAATPPGNRHRRGLVTPLSSQARAPIGTAREEAAVQTLLETIQALDAARLRHLSDLHLVADGRHATAYLCFAPPGSHLPTLVREVLPVGLAEQLQALAASGLLGQLQVTVVPWDDRGREVHLLARTHAGSATERATWRRALA